MAMVGIAKDDPGIRAQVEAATAGLVVDLQSLAAGAAWELADGVLFQELGAQSLVFRAFPRAFGAHGLYSPPRLFLHESGLDLLGVVQPAGGLLLWGWEGAHGFSGMVALGEKSARRQRV